MGKKAGNESEKPIGKKKPRKALFRDFPKKKGTQEKSCIEGGR